MKSTDWFKDAIIYQIFIDRFSRGKQKDGRPKRCRGSVFCGGNLQGVIGRLGYLQELGINTIWLSPFNTTSAYHGYHVTNFFDVDPHFRTLKTLKKLVHLAHKKQIKILMDFVPNHVSHKHPYFLDARQHKNSAYRNWFYFTKWPSKYLCFLDVKELPKLNLDHPPARKYIIKAATYWLDQGIDGFRLDHVLGPSHDFWKAFRRAVKAHKPSAVLIGEATAGTIKWSQVRTLNLRRKYLIFLLSFLGFDRTELVMKQYLGEMDGVLDFEFKRLIINFIAHKRWYRPDWLLKWKLKRHYASFPENFFLPSFLDNHDMNRFLFEAGQDRENLKKAVRIQFAQNQPPIIYYGTEAGMTHHKSIEGFYEHDDLQARQMMPWHKPDKDLFNYYKELIRKRKTDF